MSDDSVVRSRRSVMRPASPATSKVQGFLFSAARPASEIAELLASFGGRVSQAA
jgi:hypothetical protein